METNIFDMNETKGDRFERSKNVKKDKFTIIDNACLQNRNLSLSARGLIAYLISLPSDWIIYTSHLSKELHVGRDKIRKIIRELITEGYMKRYQERANNGRLGVWITKFSDIPEFLKLSPETEKPAPVNPGPDLPGLVKSALQINNNTNKKNDKEIKKKNININVLETLEPIIQPMTAPNVDLTVDFSLYKSVDKEKTENEKQNPRLNRAHDFDEFWKFYPHKVGKGAACKALLNALKKTSLRSILGALEAQKLEREAAERLGVWCPPWAHPATWLNQERWEDVVRTEEELKHESQTRSSSPKKRLAAQAEKEHEERLARIHARAKEARATMEGKKMNGIF